MSERKPRGADADCFRVYLPNGLLCPHSHRTIKEAFTCQQNTPGAGDVVAIRHRSNAPGAYRLYDRDQEVLTHKQVGALLQWEQRDK